jgi:hypothetical protein
LEIVDSSDLHIGFRKCPGWDKTYIEIRELPVDCGKKKEKLILIKRWLEEF